MSKYIAVLLCIALAGCQRNHLSHQSKTSEVDLLLRHSKQVELSMKIQPALGSTFIVCMDQAQLSQSCQTFFDLLLSSIQTKKHYHSASLEDLTNTQRYHSIRDLYVSRVMSQLALRSK